MSSEELDIIFKNTDIFSLKKGEAIFKNSHIICNHLNENRFICFVPSSQNKRKSYTINIEFINNELKCKCTCPAFDNKVKYCKHIVAVGFRIKSNPKYTFNSASNLFTQEEIAPKNDVTIKVSNNNIKQQLPKKLNEIKPRFWENYINETVTKKDIQQNTWNNSYRIHLLNFDTLTIYFNSENKREYIHTNIKNYREHNLNFDCNCTTFKNENNCKHIVSCIKLLGNDISSMLEMLINMPDFINKTAIKYGVTTNDVLNNFTIINNYGSTYNIKPKEEGLLPVNLINTLKPSKPLHLFEKRIFAQNESEATLRFLWVLNDYNFPYFSISPILSFYNKNGTISKKIKHLNDDQFNFDDFKRFKLSADDVDIISLVNNNQPGTINNEDYFEIYRQKLNNILPKLKTFSNYYLENYNYNFEENNKLIITSEFVELVLDVKIENKDYFTISPIYVLNGEVLNNYMNKTFIIIHKNQVYLLKPLVAHYNKIFDKNPILKWHINNWENVKQQFLIPASEYVTLQIDESLNYEKPTLIIEDKIISKVYLNESNDHLIITPTFCYLHDTIEKEIDYNLGTNLQVTYNNELSEFKRNNDFETDHYNYIKQLHPSFENQNDTFFIVPNNDVLKNNWLLNFYETLKNNDIEILGSKKLSKFNYNTSKPQINFKAGSGTDWFDIKVEVKFGNQFLNINDLKTSILNKQQYVKLDDGSIGILPEEWLKKYEGLFKAGKLNKKGNIEINAFQSSVIDDLTNEIDNNKNIIKFQEKIKALKLSKEFSNENAPANFKANLRDYQLHGYNWLNSLQSIGWGGCLADDMGLGKTIQMLAFIQNQVNKNKTFAALVIVPTSLIFNWENEIKKFAPKLTIHSYVGSNRNDTQIDFIKNNITLTTYGLARIDIEKLKAVTFNVVILDESQAIKNNQSQIAKAVKLLDAKNKFVMTGTPIENSTMDLYSQLDFVNPTMLGSEEQFKQNFANAIDKNKDEEAATYLKKIIQPFLLNRKKQQVAKDLPEKTETILYCEMAQDQRRVYEHYKEKIKADLIEKIDSVGLAKSGMYVLQGLLKLRQICNDAKLISDADYSKISSVKTTILFENIEELIAENHKVLVFSFFSSMLDLLEVSFNKRKIKTVKITGEVTNRQSLVNQFQTDTDTKVFLISLKAGGFGLNLTEADYVFMFDPWWNPAVEQQAIDRTHRIGQTKNVFAYKLICKDTIEEKILALQLKKKAVSDDIINVDNAILKQLKKEDIINLFS